MLNEEQGLSLFAFVIVCWLLFEVASHCAVLAGFDSLCSHAFPALALREFIVFGKLNQVGRRQWEVKLGSSLETHSL